MQKYVLITASILGILGVAIGAFRAHALRPLLEQSSRLDTFETGVKYHFYHTIVLLVIGVSMHKLNDVLVVYSAYSLIAGIVLFSGSLYLLSAFNMVKLGIVTPIGGLFFILGWILLGIGSFRSL